MSNTPIRDQIESIYKHEFSENATLLLNAPGRINLIGEHTDYNNGFVLPGAIDKSIVYGIGRNPSRLIHIRSLEDEHYSIDPEKTLHSTGPSWSKYFQAMVDVIRTRNLSLGGLNCCFGGDIPIGAGLSSSAALCCGFLFGLNKLFEWDLPLLELAKIGQAAEHRIGANVGLMDQFASLFGKRNNVICLDCLDYSYQYFPLDLKVYSLMLINSNVKHEIVDSEYNERRKSCERVLSTLQKENQDINTLRNISEDDIKGLEREYPKDASRVAFVMKENRRVQQTVEALSQHNLNRVGELLYESHEGLSKEYQVSCSELDLLVELAREEKTVLGARMMGGGFGGCTINLIHTKEVDSVVSRIKQRYKNKTGIIPASYQVSLEDGVNILNQKKN